MLKRVIEWEHEAGQKFKDHEYKASIEKARDVIKLIDSF